MDLSQINRPFEIPAQLIEMPSSHLAFDTRRPLLAYTGPSGLWVHTNLGNLGTTKDHVEAIAAPNCSPQVIKLATR
jgi:hypothetical protein